jgi:hypothetical protein
MKEMDRELQKTKMSEDFERAPKVEEVLGGTDATRLVLSLVPPSSPHIGEPLTSTMQKYNDGRGRGRRRGGAASGRRES